LLLRIRIAMNSQPTELGVALATSQGPTQLASMSAPDAVQLWCAPHELASQRSPLGEHTSRVTSSAQRSCPGVHSSSISSPVVGVGSPVDSATPLVPSELPASPLVPATSSPQPPSPQAIAARIDRPRIIIVRVLKRERSKPARYQSPAPHDTGHRSERQKPEPRPARQRDRPSRMQRRARPPGDEPCPLQLAQAQPIATPDAGSDRERGDASPSLRNIRASVTR